MPLYISHRWRLPRLITVLFALEFLFTIPALALFAIANKRSNNALWQDGYNNGFNSSPAQILYDYANYRPVHYPLVWNPWVLEYNTVISILSTFLLLVKSVCFVVHIWVPLLSFCVHLCLLGLYAFSVHAQSAPDMSDPLHQQPGVPWYIAKSCSVAFNKSNITYCRQAKAVFAVSVVLLVIFIANTVWAVYSIIPNAKQLARRKADYDEDQMLKASGGGMVQDDDGGWEMKEFPPPPTKPNRKTVRESVKGILGPKAKKGPFGEVWDGKIEGY